MKAKKLIAGAAALTLALASAFAVLPAEKANAASVVTTPVYTNDFWGRPSYNHEFTLDNGENRLKDGLDEDEMYNLSMKASGAGTGKLTIVFTNGPDQDECIWYLFAVPEGSINVSESGSWLKEDLYAREETCTFNLTFDSKGKLTNVDDLKAPANGYFLFSFVGPAASVTATFTPAVTSITPVTSDKGNSMYRMYNPNSGEHFYTANVAEGNKLLSAGWKYEGVTWTAPKTSKTPVYRLYNPNSGDHHYTTNPAEKSMLTGNGWKDEGIGWYSDDNKGVPVYRQYNKNAKTGSHNYTANLAENDMLVKNGWKAEGISWYGVK